jgi:autotransporter-associated beta strand protein
MAAVGVAVPLVCRADPLNPAAFATLGKLNLGSGSITIDTDAMTITGAVTFTGVSQAQSGATSIAVFDFTDVNLAPNVSVTVTGSHPLALLSTANITINDTINMSGGIGQTSPGAGAGGSSLGVGGGGGFGGAGGAADGPFMDEAAPGQPYAKLTLELQAGSDGGDAGGGVVGGRGGGAIELSAAAQVIVGGTLTVNGDPGTVFSEFSAGSGSGGAILISGGQGVNISANHLFANGAAGTQTSIFAAGGGGGGAIAILGSNAMFNPQDFSTAIAAAAGSVNGGAPGGDAFDSAGAAGVFTIVPLNSSITSSQSYSGPLVAQAGSGSSTPTIFVQLGKVAISSTGTLTQGCDQLIVPGSPVADAGFYSLGGYAQTVGALSGNGTIDLSNGGRLTVNMPPGSSTFSGHIINTSTSPGGPGSLIKTGSGQLALAGSSSYSGGTTINGGTLLVQSTTGSATGSGSVTVNFGGIFAGTGTISGDALVLPGGTISPGSSSAGSLTVNNLILAGSTFNTLLGGTSTSQITQLNVAGTASLGGKITVGTLGGFIPLPGESFQVMTYAFSSGSISSVINQTGKAGLSFTTSISPTGLTVTANGTPGDANLDGAVNLADFNLLAAHFNQTSQNWLTGDFNGDGVVNLLDLNALAMNFGASLQPAPPLGALVPEPCSMWLCLGGVLSCLRRSSRRRRSKVGV